MARHPALSARGREGVECTIESLMALVGDEVRPHHVVPSRVSFREHFEDVVLGQLVICIDDSDEGGLRGQVPQVGSGIPSLPEWRHIAPEGVPPRHQLLERRLGTVRGLICGGVIHEEDMHLGEALARDRGDAVLDVAGAVPSVHEDEGADCDGVLAILGIAWDRRRGSHSRPIRGVGGAVHGQPSGTVAGSDGGAQGALDSITPSAWTPLGPAIRVDGYSH